MKEKIEGEENVPLLSETGVLEELLDLQRNVAANTESFLLNTTTNLVESLNALICKYNAGKRIDFSKRGGYNARVGHSILDSIQNHHAQSAVFKFLSLPVPDALQKMEDDRELKVARNKRYDCKKRRTAKHYKSTDKDYGETSQTPDMDPEVYKQQEEAVSEGLAENQRDRLAIAERITAQSGNAEWTRVRRKVVTGSNYGEICRRFDSTSCRALVKKLLYTTGKYGVTSAMQYGKGHEEDARKAVEKEISCDVKPTGSWIDSHFLCFGASPDGLFNTDLTELKIPTAAAVKRKPKFFYGVQKGDIVEIKCPERGKSLTVEALLEKHKDLANIFDKKKPKLLMNVKHKYYYQVQGELHHTQRSYGLLVLWTPLNLRIVIVWRDDNFWKKEMEPKLVRFFFDCMLPEIVDGRYLRNMKIREPDYILRAMLKKNPKKGNSTSKEKQFAVEEVKECDEVDVIVY